MWHRQPEPQPVRPGLAEQHRHGQRYPVQVRQFSYLSVTLTGLLFALFFVRERIVWSRVSGSGDTITWCGLIPPWTGLVATPQGTGKSSRPTSYRHRSWRHCFLKLTRVIVGYFSR
jgi:hypothetical protein